MASVVRPVEPLSLGLGDFGGEISVARRRQSPAIRTDHVTRSSASSDEQLSFDVLQALPLQTRGRWATRGRGASLPSTGRTEQFEVDVARATIVRRVKRSSGELVRTRVASVGGLGLIGPAGAGDEELRALADAFFLRSRPSEEITARHGAGSNEAPEEVRIVDLFGGCGGMTLGVVEACRALGLRGRPVAAFEIDDLALSIYCRNFGGPEPKRDVGDLLAKRLSAPWNKRELALKQELGRVDFVIAGPPCQGHSNLNNLTRRNDPKNELYFRMARFVRLMRPKWVLIENVPAVQHDHGNVVARTRRALAKLGYTVDDAVVHLADLGVAQTRRRHVLVAVRTKGRGKVRKTLPKVAEIVERFRVPVRPLLWAIGDLAGTPANGTFNSSARPSPETHRRIEWLFEHGAYELDDSQRPDCHRTKKHRYTAVYGRMRPDEPGPTITGGYDTMGRGRFVHPTERRTITPHEAARIQFFPDWFDFTSGETCRSGLAQVIGNAVPPKLTYVLALEMMR